MSDKPDQELLFELESLVKDKRKMSKLVQLADKYSFGLKNKNQCKHINGEDIIANIIQKLLTGDRSRNRGKVPDITELIKQLIRSEVWNIKNKDKRISGFDYYEDGSLDNTKFNDIEKIKLAEYFEIIDKEEFFNLLNKEIAHDENTLLISYYFCDGMSANDISTDLGIDKQCVTNCIRRLKYAIGKIIAKYYSNEIIYGGKNERTRAEQTTRSVS